MMAQKKQYTSFKSGRKATSSLLIVLSIVLVCLLGGGATAMFGMAYAVSQAEASSGVVVQISVYGNDVVLDIVGGEKVASLKYVYLVIDGCELPDSIAGKAVEQGVTQIVYEGIAIGLNGNRMVGVRGYFGGGETVFLVSKEVRFS